MESKNRKPAAKKQRNQRDKFKKQARYEASKGNYQDAFADKERSKDLESSSRKFPVGIKSRVDNDAKWYYKDANILNDVASFSFNRPLGSRINTSDLDATFKNSQFTVAVPGVMSLCVGLTPGVAVDATSPINVAAQNVYSFVRYKNSGAANYDAPDLMLYIIAMDSVYACWNWLKFLYGCASTYSTMNRYEPRAYMDLNRVNYEDLVANLADFRAYLNMAAAKISAFAVPATFTYNIRHSWLFSNVFKDSDTRKAQQYMYTPAYFYKYDETSSPSGGKLVAQNVLLTPPTTPYTTAQLRALLDGMINALQYSEDIGIMSGDIIKAFGSNLFKLSDVEADYKVEATYSQEVLTQFENATYYRLPTIISSGITNWNIYQDPNTNFIKFQPKAVLASGAGSLTTRLGKYLNMHWDSPTPEQVMVASRINFTSVVSADGLTETFTSMGSEFALRCEYITFVEGSAINTSPANKPLIPYIHQMANATFRSSNDPVIWRDIYSSLLGQATFDWSPELFMFIDVQNTGAAVQLLPLRDWDNYTLLTNSNIAALNELALLSEFNVPN